MVFFYHCKGADWGKHCRNKSFVEKIFVRFLGVVMVIGSV